MILFLFYLHLPKITAAAEEIHSDEKGGDEEECSLLQT